MNRIFRFRDHIQACSVGVRNDVAGVNARLRHLQPADLLGLPSRPVYRVSPYGVSVEVGRVQDGLAVALAHGQTVGA